MFYIYSSVSGELGEVFFFNLKKMTLHKQTRDAPRGRANPDQVSNMFLKKKLTLGYVIYEGTRPSHKFPMQIRGYKIR